jgi:hypothetical protein
MVVVVVVVVLNREMVEVQSWSDMAVSHSFLPGKPEIIATHYLLWNTTFALSAYLTDRF